MILRKTTSAAVVTTIAMTAALMLSASVAQAQTAPSVKAGVTVPKNRIVYALTSDNAIYALGPNDSQYRRLGRIQLPGSSGNMIGIDFRPADKSLTKMYGLDDQGALYTIDVAANPFTVTKISTMTTRFTGGLANLMDFNPVVNALRVAGNNDQNLAVVNGTDGSSLSTTVAQTKFAYATGDVNFGQDPEISGGAYTNNFAGATTTQFYMVDCDKDTLVTIADLTATGSSNTGGGKLKTIGKMVDSGGNALNCSSTSDIDIYTDANGVNFLVGQTTRLLFSIDLSQINPNLPLGQTQNVIVKRGVPGIQLSNGSPSHSGGIYDVAIAPRTTQ